LLTQASELAVRVLVVVALEQRGEPLTPRSLAERMQCSVSYLSKVLGSLTRVGILTAVRGARGGVLLAREPSEISLLEVVEACDGFLVANYCRSLGPQPLQVCGFHVAMKEIHDTMTGLLTRWRLSDLLEVPVSVLPDGTVGSCKMAFTGCERHLRESREA
jgi:Rrf2 family transcriptional regulator, nitric oxide-sensitive transcriptional repressor